MPPLDAHVDISSGARRRSFALCHRASDIFRGWWAEGTHGAKIGGLFFEMMDPSISN